MKFDPEIMHILKKITEVPNPDSTREYAFQKAICYYNNQKYFEAHEIFEFQWKKETGELKLFIQALIQIAIAMNKIYVKPNLKGAISQTNNALNKLRLLINTTENSVLKRNSMQPLIDNLEYLLVLSSYEKIEFSNYSPPQLKEDIRNYICIEKGNRK